MNLVSREKPELQPAGLIDEERLAAAVGEELGQSWTECRLLRLAQAIGLRAAWYFREGAARGPFGLRVTLCDEGRQIGCVEERDRRKNDEGQKRQE